MSLRSEHIRKYIQTVKYTATDNVNGTIIPVERAVRLAHGYDEPTTVGNLNRTARRIWAAEATERVHEQIAYKVQYLTRKQRKGLK